MMRTLNLRRAAYAGLALVVLVYFVAGAGRVPFHGDESIWIYMSHDFEDLFVQRDASRLLYSQSPVDPEEQSLRELNNPLAKYVIALSWRAVGYTSADLNGYWVWGADWDWNAENGRIPSDGLLWASRWLPAALGAVSALAVMALGVRLGGAWVGAVAGLLLSLDASYLLHTRRAMAESTLLACGALSVMLAARYVARRAAGESPPARMRAAYLVGIGLLTGLAVATKLNGAIVALVVAIALVVWLPWRGEARRALAVAGVDLAAVSGVALAAVMALSPFLWVNPLARVRDTLRDMNVLIEAQKRGRDWLDAPGERAGALAEQVFWTQAAYYEDGIWAEWVGDQIAAYEASPLSGWRRPVWGRVALGGVFVVGLVGLLARRPSDAAQNVAHWVVLLWLVVTVVVNLAIIPFDWQRYYLTLWPEVALVEASGILMVVRGIRRLSKTV